MKFKSFALIINGLLAVAVIILYALHFSQPEEEMTTEAKKEVSVSPTSQAPQIVYINYDTLLMNYEMYHDLNSQLEAKQKEAENELGRRSKNFEKEMSEFQEKVQKRLITSRDARQREQELMQEQQNLMQYRDELTSQLMEEEQVMNRRIMVSIQEHLAEYNRSHDYQFIISNTFGQPLLYADKSLNITQEIIDGLNRKYRATE